MLINHPKANSIFGMDKNTLYSNMFLKENSAESEEKTTESSHRAF